jgi:hypothetical protein
LAIVAFDLLAVFLADAFGLAADFEGLAAADFLAFAAGALLFLAFAAFFADPAFAFVAAIV